MRSFIYEGNDLGAMYSRRHTSFCALGTDRFSYCAGIKTRQRRLRGI